MKDVHKSAPTLLCSLYCTIAAVALAAGSGSAMAANPDGSFVVALTAQEEAEAKAKAAAKKAKKPLQHQQAPANHQPPPPAKAVVKPVPAPNAVAAPPPHAPSAAKVLVPKKPVAAHAPLNVRRHLPGKPLQHKAARGAPTPAPVATPSNPSVNVAPAPRNSFDSKPVPIYPVPPPAVKTAAPAAAAVAAPAKLHAVQAARHRAVVPGTNKVVVKEPGKRLIIKDGNKTIIRHDEAARFVKAAPNATVRKAANGNNTTIINSTNNTQIYNITDADGHLVRRYRRDGDGREFDIIDNRGRGQDRDDDHTVRNVAIAAGVGLVAGALIMHAIDDVPPPRVDIPQDKYIVHYNRASDDDVYEAFSAPPVDRVERRYTLDEVRETYHLRQRMRRIELDDINFEIGSWDVDPAEYRSLERIARGMLRAIERNPNEVFMIEGYTDAVGDTEDNLTLSDRRAEAVAEVLTKEFNVPPENLTTQGYGEQYLLVDAQGPERTNRRVAVRRITPLIAESGENREQR